MAIKYNKTNVKYAKTKQYQGLNEPHRCQLKHPLLCTYTVCKMYRNFGNTVLSNKFYVLEFCDEMTS